MKDRSVEQWQHADDEVRKKLPPGVKLLRTLRGHMGAIGRIAWSPDGRMLASSLAEWPIQLWDAAAGECLLTHEGHIGGVLSVAFDSEGHTLASGGYDKTVRLWEPASGKLLRTLIGHKGRVLSVAFDSD